MFGSGEKNYESTGASPPVSPLNGQSWLQRSRVISTHGLWDHAPVLEFIVISNFHVFVALRLSNVAITIA